MGLPLLAFPQIEFYVLSIIRTTLNYSSYIFEKMTLLFFSLYFTQNKLDNSYLKTRFSPIHIFPKGPHITFSIFVSQLRTDIVVLAIIIE